MLSLYRCLLRLYPSIYRREYAEEMICVFRDAREGTRGERFPARMAFGAREIGGLLSGALREHLYQIMGGSHGLFRRFDMRPEFRFPRSTIVLMALVLAGVVLAVREANSVVAKSGAGRLSIWPALPWSLGLMLLLACTAAAVVWGILFARRRTGVQRLADLQPRPDRAE